MSGLDVGFVLIIFSSRNISWWFGVCWRVPICFLIDIVIGNSAITVCGSEVKYENDSQKITNGDIYKGALLDDILLDIRRVGNLDVV